MAVRSAEPVSVAIFAKAPVPGFTKTRLAPALGAEGAAALQDRLVRRAIGAAVAAAVGPVALWCAPDTGHPLFLELAGRHGVALVPQEGADIGARMLAAFAATEGLLLLFGSDCPSIDAGRLRAAAEALRGGADLVLDPAEDGGYGLIGGRGLPSALFAGIAWSTGEVAAETLRRAEGLGFSVALGPRLRDLDTPEDLTFWRKTMPELF